METYASFYYIWWKAILKGLTLRQGDCNVKHRGKNPGNTNSNVNRGNPSARHTNYISNTICKHSALCIKVNKKHYDKRSVKILLLDCTVTFLCFIV